MKSTATRAKSRASSVTVNGPGAGVGVGVGGSVVVIVVVVVPRRLPMRLMGMGIVKVDSLRDGSSLWKAFRGWAVRAGLAGLVSPGRTVMTDTETKKAARTAASSAKPPAAPVRMERPSKVTREFWAMHERLPVLNRARIAVPERGIEKLARPSAMRRGMACPSVTLVMLSDSSMVMRFVVVQPVAPATVQVDPVNPFVQMQEHTPRAMTLVPSLEQGSCAWHSTSACSVEAPLPFLLRKTKNSSGTSMAAATMPTTMTIRPTKPHSGRPQHLRLVTPLPPDEAPSKDDRRLPADRAAVAGGVEPRVPTGGHDVELRNQLPTRLVPAVACAGGGNAANMSERPD